MTFFRTWPPSYLKGCLLVLYYCHVVEKSDFVCTTYGGWNCCGEDFLLNSYFPLPLRISSYWRLIGLLLTSCFLLFHLISSYWRLTDLLLTFYFPLSPFIDLLLMSYFLWLISYWPVIDILLASYWPLIHLILTSYWPDWLRTELLLTSSWRLIDLSKPQTSISLGSMVVFPKL